VSGAVEANESAQRVAALLNQLEKLKRDDGARYRQILWSIQGEQRRSPDELFFRLALVRTLSAAGHVEDGRRELRGMIELLQRKKLPLSLVYAAQAVTEAVGLGMREQAYKFLQLLLNMQQPMEPAVLERIHVSAVNFAVRFGDLEVLHRVAASSTSGGVAARTALQILKEAGLLESFPAQQAAFDEVVGPVATRFQFFPYRVDGGGLRLLLTYYTNVERARWVGLYDDLLAAARKVYLAHPRGPAAFLGHVVVQIAGPYIPLTREELA
jgi:hypothetical protein